MNLFSINGAPFENVARGMLYVIYEILWKLIYYVLVLIDEVASLFYKVLGINYSGSEQGQTILDQLMNQKILTNGYWIVLGISLCLMIVFTLVSVIRSIAANEEKKSMGPMLRNIMLSAGLIIFSGPILVLIIMLIGNLGVKLVTIGGNRSVSISEIIFNSSGNLLSVYNERFATTFTSFKDLRGDFLYDLFYPTSLGADATLLDFHWYIALIGGGYILFNIICIVVEAIKHIFSIVILYFTSPLPMSKMVYDNGKSIKQWGGKFVKEVTLLLSQVLMFMLFVIIVNSLKNIDLTASGGGSSDNLFDNSIYENPLGEETIASGEFVLLNGIIRVLVVVAAINLVKNCSKLLGEIFAKEENKTDVLLENLLAKVSSKQPTRTITKTRTITTSKQTFVEPDYSGLDKKVAKVNVTRSDFSEPNFSSSPNNIVTNNFNVNQKNEVVNKMNNVNSEIANRKTGDIVMKGGYEGKFSPTIMFVSSKTEQIAPVKGKMNYMSEDITKSATDANKKFNDANKALNTSIRSGNSNNIKEAIKNYNKAYRDEAKIMQENYRRFEDKANKSMRSNLHEDTKRQLSAISNSYKKAQVEYSKTASKLKRYSDERMSTADALKLKAVADKQRETLRSASNRAAMFYQKQKKEEGE